ncbi:MAG TPA: carboxypeptidase-like regulatory domain-containing protein, partial [Hymenobacter sp.]|nr:carboxypeptidase-like regulatory domain-containing protein [Hymenobacter sp.]
QGRHCAACSKVVVDFTGMTDAEVAAWLQRRAGSTCGRFSAQQLNRPLRQLIAPGSRWRTWLAAAATLLGLRELAAEKSSAQQTISAYSNFLTHDERKAALLRHRAEPADIAATVLKGRVDDQSTGQGLPGVTVLVKGTTTGVFTNADGTFQLNVSSLLEDHQQPELTLISSSIGYHSQEIVAPLDGAPLTITMAEDYGTLTGEVVMCSVRKPWPWHPRTLWNAIRHPFRR